MLRVPVFVLLVALFVEAVLSAGYSTRTLVLFDENNQKQGYSRFFKSLKNRGHQLDFKSATDKSVQLQQFGVPNYENIIMLAPSASKIGESLSHKHLLDFLDHGGNILVGLTSPNSVSVHSNLASIHNNLQSSSSSKPAISDLYYKLAEKSGITIHSLDSQVLNNFAYSNDTNNVYTSDALVYSPTVDGLILVNGIGQTLRSDAHLALSLLTGDSYTYSVKREGGSTDGGAPDKNIIQSGSRLSLISALQTRINSRIVFLGSLNMISDEYLTAGNNKNAQLMDEISRYTFGENRMLRIRDVEWKIIGDTTMRPNRVRVSDDMVFSGYIEEFDSSCNCYVPFTADDVQFEFIRLDPFIRQFMQHDGKGKYRIEFKVPDTFGVYKLTVNYQRKGWSTLFFEELITVRPVRHDEHARFLPIASPYYMGSWSMVAGFVVFASLFLFGSKDGKKIW